MLNHDLPFTARSGRKFHVHYESNGDWWIWDTTEHVWYFWSLTGGGFNRLDQGEALHNLEKGLHIIKEMDENRLADLQEAKNWYVDIVSKAS